MVRTIGLRRYGRTFSRPTRRTSTNAMTAAAVDAIIAPANPTIGPKNTPDMIVNVDLGMGATVTIADTVKNTHGNQGPRPSPQSRTLPMGGSGTR